MNDRHRLLKWVLCVPVCLFFLGGSSSLYAAPWKLAVRPDVVRIGALYHGSRIHLFGEIPGGCDAVIEVAGEAAEETVMRKVRHWGLWMDEGEIDVREAPRLYLAMSNNPALLSNPKAGEPWGYGALEKRVLFGGDIREGETDEIFREFFRLKKSKNLYEILPGALSVTHVSDNRSTVQGAFRLPSNITPGTYQVSLSVIQKGRLLFRESVSFKVVMSGFPAVMYRLANHHAVVYGCLAIAIAVLAGLGAGLVFENLRPRKESRR